MYGSSSEEGVSYLRNRSRQYFLADASSAADDICELGCSTSVEAKRLCGVRHVVAVLLAFLVMAPVQALFVALILLAIPLLLFYALACLSVALDDFLTDSLLYKIRTTAHRKVRMYI